MIKYCIRYVLVHDPVAIDIDRYVRYSWLARRESRKISRWFVRRHFGIVPKQYQPFLATAKSARRSIAKFSGVSSDPYFCATKQNKLLFDHVRHMSRPTLKHSIPHFSKKRCGGKSC